MTDSPYTPLMFKKYATAKLLSEEAERQGFTPIWEHPRGLFSITHNGKNLFVYYAKLHINSQLGSWICQDKSLTHTVLDKEGFLTIPYYYGNQPKEVNAFFDKHTRIIQKPVLGEQSKNVHLITRREDIDINNLEDTIFEQFIDGTEYRCLVLNGQTIGMQKKTLDPTPEYPWRKHVTNLEEHEWLPECIKDAHTIASLLHMGFIAVDFMIDATGKRWILELNAMPGLHSFHHPDSGDAQNIAAQLLTAILQSA